MQGAGWGPGHPGHRDSTAPRIRRDHRQTLGYSIPTTALCEGGSTIMPKLPMGKQAQRGEPGAHTRKKWDWEPATSSDALLQRKY